MSTRSWELRVETYPDTHPHCHRELSASGDERVSELRSLSCILWGLGWNETKLSMLNRNRILRIGSRVPEMRPLSTDKDKDVQPYVVYRLYRSGSLYGNLHTGLHTASQKK